MKGKLDEGKLIKCRIAWDGDKGWTLSWEKGQKVFRGSAEGFTKFLMKLKVSDTESDPASRRQKKYVDIVNDIKSAGTGTVWVWQHMLKKYPSPFYSEEVKESDSMQAIDSDELEREVGNNTSTPARFFKSTQGSGFITSALMGLLYFRDHAKAEPHFLQPTAEEPVTVWRRDNDDGSYVCIEWKEGSEINTFAAVVYDALTEAPVKENDETVDEFIRILTPQDKENVDESTYRKHLAQKFGESFERAVAAIGNVLKRYNSKVTDYEISEMVEAARQDVDFDEVMLYDYLEWFGVPRASLEDAAFEVQEVLSMYHENAEKERKPGKEELAEALSKKRRRTQQRKAEKVLEGIGILVDESSGFAEFADLPRPKSLPSHATLAERRDAGRYLGSLPTYDEAVTYVDEDYTVFSEFTSTMPPRFLMQSGQDVYFIESDPVTRYRAYRVANVTPLLRKEKV